MKYIIIYYEFDERNTLVEKWDLPLLEAINRCRMVFKEGVYRRAEIVDYTPRYVVETTSLEKIYE